MARRHRVQSKTPHPYDTPAEMSPVGRFYCGRCNAETEHQVHVYEPADGEVTALHRLHTHRECLTCHATKCSAMGCQHQRQGAAA